MKIPPIPDPAKEYLLSLTYIDYHKISDIPPEIAHDVINLIDSGFHCTYRYNDDYTAFRKYRFGI